jgi:hypothetical protein
MIGLFFSQLILFLAAALIGFAVGWRLFIAASAARRERDRHEVERLRTDLAEAQVRRARLS